MCPPIKKKYFQPFNKNGNATYVVPILEAVYSAADVLPALKSVAGGALWIARVVQVGTLSSAYTPITDNGFSLIEGVQVEWKR